MMDGTGAESLTTSDGRIDHTAVQRRITELKAQAVSDAEQFSPPASPPDPENAQTYLTEGAGQAIGLYVVVRTGGRLYPFSKEEFEALEAAMNTWFQLYAACFGETITPSVSIRTAAHALIDTEDIGDVAKIVTNIP